MSLALMIGCVGCEDEQISDRTPPGAVTDLRTAAIDDSSLTLLWTAPGDDGDQGQAAAYDLRHALGELPASWDHASPLDSLPSPGPAGVAEQHRVRGLSRGQVYFFALRALDEMGNAAPFSNPVQVQAGDPAPPARITDLAATDLLPHGVTLTFTAPGDDSTAGQALRYELRRSRDPIGEATWAAADSIPTHLVPQPAGFAEAIRQVDLDAGSTYHYAVRAVDDAGKAGEVSNDLEVALPADTVPPGVITDLSVETTVPYQATLTWTAPGNDGDESRALAYEIRYTHEPLTEASWDTAAILPNPPAPDSPGTPQSYVAGGFPRNARVWFAVRATDEEGNLGGMSNEAQGHILPHGDLWLVKQDGTGNTRTVQEAIDLAADEDEILVWPGTYLENLNLRKKSLILRSRSGPEVTILDGSGGDLPVIQCDSSLTRVTLEGFTITGGSGKALNNNRAGGGIYSDFGVTMTIRGNIIRGNRIQSTPPGFYSRGGGLAIIYSHSQSIIESNLVEGNYSSGSAAGMHIVSRALIQNNVIRGNTAGGGDGAGIYCSAVAPVSIHNNLIVENIAGDHGGGMYLTNHDVGPASFDVCCNILVGNIAMGKGYSPDCAGGAIWMVENGAFVHHNTIAFNRAEKALFPTVPVGGICCRNPKPAILLEHNLLYRNDGGGVGVYVTSRVAGTWTQTLRRNLLFENGVQDIYTGVYDQGTIDLVLDGNIFEDPLFCVEGIESRGELAGTSPALHQTFGLIGAVGTASCPPYSTSRTRRSND